jgi:hypothetical protein
MDKSDIQRFSDLLHRASEFYPRDVSPSLLDGFMQLLSGYPFADVEKAFNKHFATSKFFPTPADIIENMPGNQNQHPGENEAWAIALVALDEDRSVIYTDQIASCLSIARELYQSGDSVAARMAFKDAYRRMVAGSPVPVWRFSQGYNRDERALVVQEAFKIGIVDESLVLQLVPDYVPKSPELLERFNLMMALGYTPSRTH